jgi:serine protease Do
MRHLRTAKAEFTAAAVFAATLGIAWSAAGQTIRGPFPPSRIGVGTRDVTAADVSRNKLPAEFGAFVDQVDSGGPAEEAGIRTGDVIVEFDGVRVRSSAELQRLVSETPVGRAVKVGVVRDGKRIDMTITTGANPNRPGFWFQTPEGRDFVFPTPDFREGPQPPPQHNRPSPDLPFRRSPRPSPGFVFPGPIPLPDTPRLGIAVQDLTPQLAEYFHTKEGVLVATVEDRSPASRAGVKAGDIIISIDGRPVAHPDDVRRVVVAKRAGDAVTLGLVRDGKPLTMKVTVAGDLQGAVERF